MLRACPVEWSGDAYRRIAVVAPPPCDRVSSKRRARSTSKQPENRLAATAMRDLDIRTALDAQLLAEHPPDDTLIFHEFGVAHGAARIDIGLVNGSLEGFEIKSDRDTLRRLPAQVEAYNRVFDRVWIVVSGKHVDRLEDVVPRWWGVRHACHGPNGIEIKIRRKAKLNPRRQPIALAQLLWRNELLVALAELDIDHGMLSKPKRVLQQTLVDAVELDELARIVCDAIKRRDWRPR